MMRAMDKEAGFLALTDGLVSAMLEDSPDVQFVLIFKSARWLHRFAEFANAKAVLKPSHSNFIWDQVAVPMVAWRERADVIINPKFFVPFLSPCPVTMGVQEPSWFTRPDEYARLDRWYQRFMIPRSIRRCAHVFPNSRFILEENRRVLGMAIEHATVQYSAADPRFRPAADSGPVEAFRAKFGLPQRFVLVLSRVLHPDMHTKEFFPGKSPEVAYRAFLRIRDQIPHDLVLVGRRIRDYLLQTEGPQADFKRVRFVEFVPFEELHLLYNAAEIFVNPCAYEGCPNTVLQAMACGCPMVVIGAGGSADVAAGGALLARPGDDVDMAEKIRTFACDLEQRHRFGALSLERSREFTWARTAAATMGALRAVVAKPAGAAGR